MAFGTTQKRVAAMVGAVLGLILCSHVVVELAGWRLLQPATDESLQVVEAFRQRGERVDVALLGSSRMRRAVVVSVLEEELAGVGQPVTAFNFGLQAGTVPAFYIVARDVLRGELTPKVIVVGLGVRALNSNNPRYVRTIRHMASPMDLFGPLGPRLTNGSEVGAGLSVAFRAPGTLLQMWRLGQEPEGRVAALLERKGSIYDPGDGSGEGGLSKRTRKRALRTREFLLREFDVQGRGRWALAQLFAMARERGVAVVAVNLPVSEEFAEAAYQRGQYQLYIAALRAECAEAFVPWIDANSVEHRPAGDQFYDGDHLNAVGATAFSRWLAGQLASHLSR